jgi:hypothetical protein
MGKIAEIIGKVVGGSASSIVDSVGKVVDDLNLSAEEKAQLNQKLQEEVNRHTEAIEKLSVERLQAELGDTSNARNTNAQIQESEKASWIAKNLPYYLDAIMVIAFFVGLLMIMYKAVPESNKELFYTGFGLLGGFVSTVMNFHRGSSSGSKASADTLRHLAKNK